ncbi:MAG: hypothetical protein OEM32_08130 [Acidimicrobiia bacterium]|nr:hypothetical protein [Acidimicrobiia bacterium]
MDRSRTAPIVLLATAVGFLAWSIVLLVTPGGSRLIERTQTILSGATLAYGLIALVSPDLVHNRRIRYLLIFFAVAGAIIVLGLAADQDSSRSYARLGWAALLAGYLGSIVVWSRLRQHRPSVLLGSVVGLVVIASAVGIASNCDPAVQRSWCDPLYEEEEALAERIAVEGQLFRVGRAGGSQGAALVAYVIGDESIEDVTHPPGEWVYEERPLQSIEVQRGRFASTDTDLAHCKIDVKVEVVPAGNVETIYVTCGDEA